MNTNILTVKQSADYLKVSRYTIYSWAEQGKIKCAKLGTRVIFRREDLDEFVAANIKG